MRLLSVCTFHPQQLNDQSQERGFGTGHTLADFGLQLLKTDWSSSAWLLLINQSTALTSYIHNVSTHLCLFIMNPIHIEVIRLTPHVCRCPTLSATSCWPGPAPHR